MLVFISSKTAINMSKGYFFQQLMRYCFIKLPLWITGSSKLFLLKLSINYCSIFFYGQTLLEAIVRV